MNELLETIKENKIKMEELNGETFHLTVFSNITLNLLEPFLRKRLSKEGYQNLHR